MVLLQGDEIGLGAYQNLGDLLLDFGEEDSCTSYQRGLAMDEAKAWVTYEQEGRCYQREAFASYPAKTMIFRFRGQMERTTLGFDLAQICDTETWKPNGCLMQGHVSEGGLKFALCMGMETDGTCYEEEHGLVVEDAKEIVLYITALTDYGWEYPKYRRTDKADICKIAEERIRNAAEKGYEVLWQEHKEDYQKLYKRTVLHIGQEKNDLPTDVLLHNYKEGKESRLLESLLYQYGRYLLISSSRQGGLPANLQGVWNDSNKPAWQSDYHLNINLQMNYWPALSGNIPETELPLMEYLNRCLVIPGRMTAYAYTGIGDPECKKKEGWMAHTQNNIFGHTGPGSDWKWGWAPTVGAFILQNVFEYYRFTKDIDVLRKEIYPAMEEAGRMWSRLLIQNEQGEWVASPGFSPEHGPVSAGTTFDQTLVWQLYYDLFEAADALCENGWEAEVDQELIRFMKSQFARIHPCKVGAWGQIKEWMEEDEWENRGIGTMGVEEHHRHFSHIMGLFPGNCINSASPELVKAAKVSLLDRGDEGPSWSMALRICLWARLGEGEQCFKYLKNLISHNIFPNLWSYHPPFQIDGNFGMTAGIGEMLVQSHQGVMELLPALPKAWEKNGSFQGILARGNYQVDAAWEDGDLKTARITAGADGQAVVRWKNKEWKKELKKGETLEISTENN